MSRYRVLLSLGFAGAMAAVAIDSLSLAFASGLVLGATYVWGAE